MTDIVLTTFNARYQHAAFALRYLKANLGELESRATIVEFSMQHTVLDAVERILAMEPKILGVSVYIWNIDVATQLVQTVKTLRPDIIVVIGGPEVSYDYDELPIVAAADHLITGEGDLAFRELCQSIRAGQPRPNKIIPGGLPTFEQLQTPYHLYTDEDVRHRVIYVEASRGCPYRCEFCLSSLEVPVRQVPLETFQSDLDRLWSRGARQFKFIDRTFNLNARVSQTILQYFLERYEPGTFLHFEMVPDRFPESLRTIIQQFPPGAVQFEIGIQTLNEEVASRIQRRQDLQKTEDNLRFLRQETGVHIHADLIVGLPGESLESFGCGFDRLYSWGPHEIQVGMLKRLRGTPIVRHDQEWQMKFSSHAPYEILSHRLLAFDQVARMRRFAKYWDLIANSGNFPSSLRRIVGSDSPFGNFLELSDWLHVRDVGTRGIALNRLADLIFEFLVTVREQSLDQVKDVLAADYARSGRRDRPSCLRSNRRSTPTPNLERKICEIPERQRRRLP